MKILCSLGLALFSWGARALDPLPISPPVPADNPQSPEKVLLGSQLFTDMRISAGGNFACMSCHALGGSGGNNLPNALLPDGEHHSRHKVPTVWNAAFAPLLFWGAGAKSLEEQAEGPLEEMGLGSTDAVVARVAAIPGYVDQIHRVFPGEEPSLGVITRAIAAYERTLLTPDSPVDRYLRGDVAALSADARAGMALFESVGCTSCHAGVLLGGQRVERFPKFADATIEAKYHFEQGDWRVAPLRNVALTAPYFHNGAVRELEEAVRVMAKLELNCDLGRDETVKISSFLRALTGELPTLSLPKLPPLK